MSTPQEVSEALARMLAHRRCGDAVWMSGRHNPTPGEVREAQRFVDNYITPAVLAERKRCAEIVASTPSLRCFAGDGYISTYAALSDLRRKIVARINNPEETP